MVNVNPVRPKPRRMFLSAHQGYIHLIENTVYEILIVWNIKKCNLFQWCNAEFSASLFRSSASHDFSEIILISWFAAQETIIIINNVENSYIYFQYSFMNRKFTRMAFNIFYITNVYKC